MLPLRLPLLVLAAALLWFGNLEHRPLMDPDEGRYAEIPREMVASGDWLTPRLNGIKYFEKPPLQYWATAAAYEAFGEHHWSARLWSALTGFLGLLAVGYTGARLFGAEAGLNAALVLGSSVGYVAVAQINTLDMGVTFFLGLALCAFLLAQQESAAPRARLGWMALAWTAAGGAVLSKGLIGLLLPGLAFGIYVLMQRDWRLVKRLHPGRGALVLAAVTAPWFVAVSLANPEFFDFFFIHEHFERFLTKAHQRYQPWWWFVPILLAGILPWIVSAGAGVLRAWSGDAGPFRPRRFLLLWAAVIFLFFSASSSKLHAYILPMFPALALLAGERLAQAAPRSLLWQMAPGALAWLLLLAAALYVMSGNGPALRPSHRDYANWVGAAAAIGLAGALAALYGARRGWGSTAVMTMALGALAAGELLVAGFEVAAPHRSGRALAQAMQPLAGPGTPIYSVGTYEQTIPFYLKRTVTLVGYRSELGFGLDQEPGKWVPDMGRFPALWKEAPEALAVMTPLTYQMFSKEGLPMAKIAESRDHVVVRKP